MCWKTADETSDDYYDRLLMSVMMEAVAAQPDDRDDAKMTDCDSNSNSSSSVSVASSVDGDLVTVTVAAAAAVRPRPVRGQAARLDVRVDEAAERPGAGVREQAVVGRHVVVLVPPADRHRALEPVTRVLERRGQRVFAVRLRVRGPHGHHVELLETVVHEEPAQPAADTLFARTRWFRW